MQEACLQQISQRGAYLQAGRTERADKRSTHRHGILYALRDGIRKRLVKPPTLLIRKSQGISFSCAHEQSFLSMSIFRLMRFGFQTLRPVVSRKKRGFSARFEPGGAVPPRVLPFSKARRFMLNECPAPRPGAGGRDTRLPVFLPCRRGTGARETACRETSGCHLPGKVFCGMDGGRGGKEGGFFAKSPRPSPRIQTLPRLPLTYGSCGRWSRRRGGADSAGAGCSRGR